MHFLQWNFHKVFIIGSILQMAVTVYSVYSCLQTVKNKAVSQHTYASCVEFL